MKPKFYSSFSTGQKCLWLALVGLFLAQANAAPVITSFKMIGSNIEIVVENVPVADELRIQTSGILNTWPKLNGSIVVNNGGGKFTFTAPKPSATKAFFRAISIQLGTGVDPDGDGMPTALENTEGSDFALFDTDDDGFSDGVEYAYGTDANDASSHPSFLPNKPTVNFILADSTATEGAGPHQVQILFDRSYSGTVNYAINAMSNTAAGTDYAAVSGSISMSGTSGIIPITPMDDANVSGQRVIIIDLKLNAENYFIGGQASHIVMLKDDDAWWTGTLVPASGETDSRIFRVKIASQGGTTTAAFGAGAGNDGLPVPVVTAGGGGPAIESTSISSSMIPKGLWPAAGVVNSVAQFHAESPLFSVAGGNICNVPLRRQLQLNAQPTLNSASRPHLLEGFRIVGDYAETLTGVPSPLAGASVTQSSEFFGSYPASNAIDGDLNTFTYTDENDLTPSWTLTLPPATPIVEIVLYDGFGSPPLSDITVSVFSDSAATVPVFTSAVLNPGNALGSPASISVSTGTVNARVIRVSRPGPYLTLGEVELVGAAAGPLLATQTGSFILVRDIPPPLPVLSPLVPSTP